MPAGQGLHALDELAASVSDQVPGGHAWQLSWLEDPTAVEKYPLPQARQLEAW